MATSALERSLVLPAIALLLLPAVLGAQAPTTPDLLGIHAGMLGQAARATLQKRAPQVIVQPTGTGFSLSITDPQNQDMVSVYLTGAPNDPAVWMIQRTQNFYPTNPMSAKALLDALHQKYGKETLTARGGSLLYWIFDQSGHLLPSADEGLTACVGGASNFINLVRDGLTRQLAPLEQTCFRSFNAVTATLNTGVRDPQLLLAYTIELVNLPSAFRAATATGNARNADAERERQELLRKANEKKPVL
jgi:hypothetical protein